MNKRKIAVGPGASSLILIAVVLALSVLTVLTMIAARNDEALTRRSIETREEIYSLFAAGEKSLAKLDGVLASCLAENPEEARRDASACLNRAREIAADAGCYKIMLMTGAKDAATLNFYRSAGFDDGEKTAFILRL